MMMQQNNSIPSEATQQEKKSEEKILQVEKKCQKHRGTKRVLEWGHNKQPPHFFNCHDLYAR